MSRIEDALEKAARMRAEEKGLTRPEKPESRPQSRPAPLPPPPADAVKVTNRLLVAASDPHTPLAEEYRKLKSVLVRLTRGEQFRNLIMVTSSVGSEGKSVTSLNLALTLAQEYDHTVLLVDADLRKPSLHSYLGIDQGTGLSECLLDGADIRDALVRTGIGKLTLLPAGRPVRNPAEIFSSQRARDLFLEMKRRYRDRYVIIDTPPVLPFSEARSIGTVVDGILLVVKEGTVPLDSVNETLDCLKGNSILGIVYNEAAIEDRMGHYEYYRQGYA